MSSFSQNHALDRNIRIVKMSYKA